MQMGIRMTATITRTLQRLDWAAVDVEVDVLGCQAADRSRAMSRPTEQRGVTLLQMLVCTILVPGSVRPGFYGDQVRARHCLLPAARICFLHCSNITQQLQLQNMAWAPRTLAVLAAFSVGCIHAVRTGASCDPQNASRTELVHVPDVPCTRLCATAALPAQRVAAQSRKLIALLHELAGQAAARPGFEWACLQAAVS